jgi:hypothetical protein
MHEWTNIQEYLSDTDAHFVFFFKPKEGNMRAYGVPRRLIQHSRHFVACVDNQQEWDSWSESGKLVTLGLDINLKVNIPENQLTAILEEMVNIDPTRRMYRIVQTDFSWDRSRILYSPGDDVFDEGFANNCQDDTARTISFLEHMSCC